MIRLSILSLTPLLFIHSFIVRGHELSPETKAQLDIFAQGAYSTLSTVYNTYMLASCCLDNNIPGDFVECGVAAGTQIAAMALACQHKGIEKSIHLFDSFEGIPLAGPHDDSQPGLPVITHNRYVDPEKLLISSGITVHSIENVEQNMNKWGVKSKLLQYHKGWFQHTLPLDAQKIKAISLLRIDGDLYESTKVCLEYLYPQVQPGGYVIIDDYALAGCRKAVKEYLAQYALSPSIITIPGGNPFGKRGPVYWKVS